MSTEAAITDLKLDKVNMKRSVQPRAVIDQNIVDEYAADMRAGATFPPIVVFKDKSGNHWLGDGFHRVQAALGSGITKLSADVRKGTRRDAILHAVGANADHGQRRTNADKRRAVTMLLEDKEWAGWSDSEIARRCAVSRDLVSRIKSSLAESTSEPVPTKRTYTDKHGTKTTMNTANIGRSKPAAGRTSRKPVAETVVEIKSLAGRGHVADQIAGELGHTASYIRDLARKHDVVLPDKAIGKRRRVRPDRVLAETVTALEGLALGASFLSDLTQLDRSSLRPMIESMGDSLKTLNRLHRQLKGISNGA